jgi:hypothetical protein
MLKSSVQKSSIKYNCEKCNYNTSRYSQYQRHLDTSKHKNSDISTVCQQISTNFNKESSEYKCDCGKIYKERTGLWRHKKMCDYSNIDTNNNNNISDDNNIISQVTDVKYLTSLVLEVMKSNTELQKQNNDLQNKILDICKTGNNGTTNNIINNTISNSNNKTFNLQVFLNETCKDAMNISEFIESIKLQVSDLENVGRVGYIEGISNIIIKNLQALEVEKRPVHCTDQKREVMYVKEDNIWEKEDESNKRLRKLVRAIAHKNICMLKAFRDKYPDCEQYDSKKGSQYNKLVIEAMGGKGDNDYEKNTKIIKKIAKAVGIDKS